MALTLGNITFDCDDPPALAGFWAEVLGREVGPESSEFFAFLPGAQPDDPKFLFLKVPEPRTAKSRIHIDLHGGDGREAEVERLVGLGATVIGDHDEWGTRWTVLHDPEGHEFCVGEPSTENPMDQLG
jgi:catechol 2,3-dioxygenase-like lactoylglutathione lyase family enzyme